MGEAASKLDSQRGGCKDRNNPSHNNGAGCYCHQCKSWLVHDQGCGWIVQKSFCLSYTSGNVGDAHLGGQFEQAMKMCGARSVHGLNRSGNWQKQWANSCLDTDVMIIIETDDYHQSEACRAEFKFITDVGAAAYLIKDYDRNLDNSENCRRILAHIKSQGPSRWQKKDQSYLDYGRAREFYSQFVQAQKARG